MVLSGIQFLHGEDPGKELPKKRKEKQFQGSKVCFSFLKNIIDPHITQWRIRILKNLAIANTTTICAGRIPFANW